MDSSKKGTARLGPADNPLGRTAPPCLSKTRRDKGRAPFEVNPAAKAWASPPALEALRHPKTNKDNIVHAFPQSGSRVGRVLPVAIRPSLELAAHARDAVQIQSESPENCCLRIEEHDGT